ncbi:MAG: type III-B CRISPR module RAMP protein Cmr4 [Lachnospiraceae bacterium]|nr:type III-B CRISPR module RAMP protein Cmr4 [Lachnospiraceae bacterium]
MKSRFFKVKCVTNLHMGSGDINFSIIDNEVQRDPVTNFPAMYSSGVKGALREHFENIHEKSNEKGKDVVKDIFGTDIKQSNESASNKDRSEPGNLKFLTANLLLIPVCSSDKEKVYYLVTTKTMLLTVIRQINTITGSQKELLEAAEKLDDNVAYGFDNLKEKTVGIDGISVEVKGVIPSEIRDFLKVLLENDFEDAANKIVIVPDKIYKKVDLPVLARNQLENGISQNLWYEEVVPHEAIFVFGVLSNGTGTGDTCLKDFAYTVKENPLIQFGGNATVGYGLTTVSKLQLKEAVNE